MVISAGTQCLLVPVWEVWDILQKQERLWGSRCKQAHSKVASKFIFLKTVKRNDHTPRPGQSENVLSWNKFIKEMKHSFKKWSRVLGLDGRLKSKKEIEGLNKVAKRYFKHKINESWACATLLDLQEMQAKKEAEMVQKIIEKVTRMQILSKIISILVIKMTIDENGRNNFLPAGKSWVQGAGGRCWQEGIHQALRCYKLNSDYRGYIKHYAATS